MRYYEGLPEYKKLEDIPLPDGGIDGKVASLVMALGSIRVGTKSSCEGHLDPHKHRHPWVGFNPFSYLKIGALQQLVDGYNEGHEIKWSVHENWLTTHAYQYVCCEYANNKNERKRMSRVRLVRLQESAEELAHYIFDHRQDEDIRELILAWDF